MTKDLNDPKKDYTEVVERQFRELSSLAEMNKKIHSTMKMERLLQIMVEQAVIGVNFERGLIYLVEDDFLRCVASLDRIKKEKGFTVKSLKGFKMDETAVEVLVVQSGKSIYVNDAWTDKRVSQKRLKITDSKEYCAVPLKGRSGVLGVLTADKVYSRNPIVPDEIQTLELFAGHISLAIENAVLFEEKERFAALLEKKISERTLELAQTNARLQLKMKELSTLFEISGSLNKNIGVNEVLELTLSLVKGLGHPVCAVHLWEGGSFGKAFQIGLDDAYLRIEFPMLEKKIKKTTLQEPEAFLLEDLKDISKSSPRSGPYLKNDNPSKLIVPLRSKDKLLGVLVVFILKGHAFGKEQVKFFSAFGLQVSMALKNALAFQEILDQKNRMENLSRKLEQENISLREKMRVEQEKKFVVGRSSAMKTVMALVQRVSSTDTSVIIYGETGTGKELIANTIHEMGRRKLNPLIKVNCAAIPEELLESELFGHEKGAFTGAHDRRTGMFQLAQGGTIFLDEIGDISLKTQTKLLRVLQESEIQPLGSTTSIKMDVRVIAATNKDLQIKIEEGTFRSDLFYRLNVFPITMPPLRDRLEDIPRLVAFFIDKYAHLKKGKAHIDKDVIGIFLKYSWPGNIRELENIIERLMIISGSGDITITDLPREMAVDAADQVVVRPLNEAVFDFKKNLVRQALSESSGKNPVRPQCWECPDQTFQDC
ncbi:sigma-54-dependent Fis family transcriptional regulator [Desulfosarcina cetonica]|uniref:sigma-54-dependent Fis family transcriptional regulator n=1 Tax=Desulfosarcina cetonica TaxID=90730 RepID=UPI0006CFAE0D|nr:sigma 54-interacting transcriptional regulator [Desulfosarcina cetonica]